MKTLFILQKNEKIKWNKFHTNNCSSAKQLYISWVKEAALFFVVNELIKIKKNAKGRWRKNKLNEMKRTANIVTLILKL